jgi:hypothetical protein
VILALLKSHVKQHTRISKTGKASIVNDYDDRRRKRAAEIRPNVETQLQGLPPALREKCRRAEPGKGHEITLLKIEAALLLKKGVFGLISAGRNPNSDLDRHLTDQDIDRRYQSLKDDLKKKGLKWVNVNGNYDGEEQSMWVLNPDVTRSELVDLGEKYNQDSVIYTEKGKNELIYTTGNHKGERNEGSGYQETPDADNYYTELQTLKGKMKFSLNFDFDKLVKAFHGLYKSHIRLHPRMLPSGQTVMVTAHEDKRREAEIEFHQATHVQRGGGYHVGKLSKQEIIDITKRGLITLGMNKEAKEVNEHNVALYIERVLHTFGMKGTDVDLRTRQAFINPEIKAAAGKIISLFESVRSQLA